MKFMAGGELAEWWDEAYGGETGFHTDFIIETGERPLDILLAVLGDSELLSTARIVPAKIHCKLSMKEIPNWKP